MSIMLMERLTMQLTTMPGLCLKPERHVWLQGKHAEQQLTSQPMSDTATEPEPLFTTHSSTSNQQEGLWSQAATASRADPDSPASALAHPITLCDIFASQQVCSVPASVDMQAQTGDREDWAECIICWEAPANVILQPCGHMCACAGCIPLLFGLAVPHVPRGSDVQHGCAG